MSYTLRESKAGWEIQNGSGITVTVPFLAMVEEAVTMLTKKKLDAKEAPAVKLVAEAEPLTKAEKVGLALKGKKKLLTVGEIAEAIEPGMDEAGRRSVASTLTVLTKAKVLKRKKVDGVFAYSLR